MEFVIEGHCHHEITNSCLFRPLCDAREGSTRGELPFHSTRSKGKVITTNFNIMKKRFQPILLVVLVSLFIFGCRQPLSTDQVLEDPESRTAVFERISQDPELMTEFMDHLDDAQMGMMMRKQDMHQMMAQNPEMMHGMMQGMIQDGQMMNHMMQMMHQEGMISEDCMRSMSEMMKGKGMSTEDHMMEH